MSSLGIQYRWQIIFASLIVLLPFASSRAEQPERPNVVLIISDDQAWTDYGFMGHDAIETPNLDKLAEQSVVFRRGYVPTALCRPSLMTLATGLYAHQHRTTGNDPAATSANQAHQQQAGKPARELLISHIDKTGALPQWLSKLGYVSHQSGKWWEGNFARGGFTHGMTRGYPQKGGRHGDDGLKIGREGMRPLFDFMDSAIEQEKPFFVWYAPFLPHTPHNPPERLLKKYQTDGRSISVARYYAMCEWFDETCGQLLDRIDKNDFGPACNLRSDHTGRLFSCLCSGLGCTDLHDTKFGTIIELDNTGCGTSIILDVDFVTDLDLGQILHLVGYMNDGRITFRALNGDQMICHVHSGYRGGRLNQHCLVDAWWWCHAIVRGLVDVVHLRIGRIQCLHPRIVPGQCSYG